MNISEVYKKIDIHRNTVMKFYHELRVTLKNYYLKQDNRLRGESVIVQIIISLVCHKSKYHNGCAIPKEVRVFVCVDTSFTPLKGFMCVVLNRNEETLYSIIKDVIIPVL
ncbi:hypothetical protein DMUE_4205 [Dictyocoela muelleri]|nr:hypothetical protein DMUE_4205 [Dictyocoela muelleri]